MALLLIKENNCAKLFQIHPLLQKLWSVKIRTDRHTNEHKHIKLSNGMAIMSRSLQDGSTKTCNSESNPKFHCLALMFDV